MIKKKIIAIIPARGGSKRIKKKNIKSFFGKPVISYAIETAKKTKIFDKIIVSTNDINIAKISSKYGATVPFIRPNKISTDSSTLNQVIFHAIKKMKINNKNTFAICCIFPATPLMQSKDLKKSYNIFKSLKWEYVFAAAKFSKPIERSFYLNKKKQLILKFPKKFKYIKQTQKYDQYYHDAGQFYWGCATAWLEEKPVFSSETIPIFIPADRVQDIDTPEDWRRAEQMFQCTL